MALITTYTVYPTIGALWQGATQKWESLVSDTTLTLTSGSETILTLAGLKLWFIQAVGAVDTNKYVFAAMDVRLTSVEIPATYCCASPGWRYVPRIQPYLYGARVTKTSYADVMLNLRRRIWIDVCAANAVTWTEINNNLANTNFEQWMSTAPIYARYQTIADALICVVIKPAWSYTMPGNQPPTDAVATSATYPAYVASSPDGIVQALQDIAGAETQASFNNGAYTVLIRSGDTLEIP